MQFPKSPYPNKPYFYEAYPAWVTLSDGRHILVKDEADHAAFEAEIKAEKKSKTLTLPKKVAP
ncbi:MAG TPA: hypothetical protein PLI96_07995 [Halothiobacillus sp.]|nr:MAG: hypothetical protein B7X10_00015 [Burkholderiales bacterium 21-58-4]HUN00409.1 hypothetical protein [Halothiobacillus sp.]